MRIVATATTCISLVLAASPIASAESVGSLQTYTGSVARSICGKPPGSSDGSVDEHIVAESQPAAAGLNRIRNEIEHELKISAELGLEPVQEVLGFWRCLAENYYSIRAELRGEAPEGADTAASLEKGTVPATSEAVIERRLDKSGIRAIQSELNARGYDAGAPDGLDGRQTRSAIAAFQRDNGLDVTGSPSLDLLDALTGAGTASAGSSRPPQAPRSDDPVTVSDMTGSCEADMASLTNDMNRISAQAAGGGVAICNAHRANYEVLTRGADIVRRCQPGNEAQAVEFERAANDSRAALNTAC
ncbi:peptidoglycan-binding domain-containing protein [Aurantimonas sp. A2-1-M11]|uniref:peptidoglycan-binding domain-containing protein n=1 Tax=Aurantimonas sp. A2-1-M11 TaxID=3113712 RepID=UPI002F950360